MPHNTEGGLQGINNRKRGNSHLFSMVGDNVVNSNSKEDDLDAFA
jgi:hypothetical protein